MNSENLLKKFLSMSPDSTHQKDAERFVDYIIQCYEEYKDIEWEEIGQHISTKRLEQLQYAEYWIKIAYGKFLDSAIPVLLESNAKKLRNKTND